MDLTKIRKVSVLLYVVRLFKDDTSLNMPIAFIEDDEKIQILFGKCLKCNTIDESVLATRELVAGVYESVDDKDNFMAKCLLIGSCDGSDDTDRVYTEMLLDHDGKPAEEELPGAIACRDVEDFPSYVRQFLFENPQAKALFLDEPVPGEVLNIQDIVKNYSEININNETVN